MCIDETGRIGHPKRKWGPTSLSAPTAPSEGYAGVRNLDPRGEIRFRSWLTSSGVASEAAFSKTLDLRPKTLVPLPFCGPSWGTHSRVLLRLRHPQEDDRGRIALETNASSGASYRLAPKWERTPNHCPPAEIGSSVPSSSPGFPQGGLPLSETGTSVPITLAPCTCRPSRKSGILVNQPVDNVDIAHNAGTNRHRAERPRKIARILSHRHALDGHLFS